MDSNELNIQESFDQTLEESVLIEVGVDLSEIGLDSLLTDETIKEIPIIKTVFAFVKLGANIHDKLFLKKLLSFLQGLAKVDPKDRKKMITKIDDSKKYRVKVGEKLLYLIDKSNDWTNSNLVGKLFILFLEEKITIEEFITTAEIISRTSTIELNALKDDTVDDYAPDKLGSLSTSGLFEINFDEGSIRQEGEPYGTYSHQGPKLSIVDSGVYYKINKYGKIVRSIL